MTLAITACRMTSNATPHTATGFPDGWRVTWLGDRTVDYNLAITAMKLAEAVADQSQHTGEVTADVVIRSFAAELELGMTLNEVKRLVILTLPPVVHQAAVPDAGVVTCDGVGGETFLSGDVTCPACLELNGRPVLHDTHAIPATDEPEPAQKYLPGDWVDLTLRNARVFGVGATDEHSVLMVGHDTMPEVASIALTDDVIVTVLVRTRGEAPAAASTPQARSCPSCSHCGMTFHVEAEQLLSTAEMDRAVNDETDPHHLAMEQARLVLTRLIATAPAEVAAAICAVQKAAT